MTNLTTTAAPALLDGFEKPFVDVDEDRLEPVRHRYVHGGFADTDTRFSFYFPPVEQYEGRFFQHFTPFPDSEHLAPGKVGPEDKIGFAFASGGYFVETNGGGHTGELGSGVDVTIPAYRANAAAAEHSRVIAQRVYGEHRPFGYAYGGSGGAFRTMGAAENTVGIWDGFVPYVPGSPVAIPNVFSVRMHALRVLGDALDGVVDAMEPGGSGDPAAGLTEEQREALAEVTRMGFPIRSWFGHRGLDLHGFGVLAPGMRMADSAYFEEFWSTPGHLGADPASSVHRDRVRQRGQVTELLTRPQAAALGLVKPADAEQRGGVDAAFRAPGASADPVVAVRFAPASGVRALGAELVLAPDAAEPVRLIVERIVDDVAVLQPTIDAQAQARILSTVRTGDAVEIDNSMFLAAQTYHRHQVPGPEFPVWDQFLDEDGAPRHPQRPFLLGPLMALGASGTVQSGRFEGRMIMVASLLDREAYPWQADWYRRRVQEHLGDRTDDRYRLWYVDNALHGDDEQQADPTRTVSYLGVLHEALRELAAWVEEDREPAPTTDYAVVDGQVRVPATADERRGVQPVVALTVDGRERADVAPGAAVTLRAVAEVPGSVGRIVRVEWDLDGSGAFTEQDATVPGERVTAERQHRFTEIGTHFVTARVTAQRASADGTPFGRLQNLARVRIVVG